MPFPLYDRILSSLKIGPKKSNVDIELLFDNANATPSGFRIASGSNDLQVRTGGGAWGGLPVDPVTRNVTTSTALTVSDKKKVITVRTLTGAINLTFPAPADGMDFIILDADFNAEVNNITFTRFAAEKIQGVAANFVAKSNGGVWRVFSNGTDWFFI